MPISVDIELSPGKAVDKPIMKELISAVRSRVRKEVLKDIKKGSLASKVPKESGELRKKVKLKFKSVPGGGFEVTFSWDETEYAKYVHIMGFSKDKNVSTPGTTFKWIDEIKQETGKMIEKIIAEELARLYQKAGV